MRSPLSDLLHRPFERLRVAPTRVAWSKMLGVDPATLSRVLNGDMTLTAKRASDWASVLFKGDTAAAVAFAEQMLSAARETRALRERIRDAALPQPVAEAAFEPGEVSDGFTSASQPVSASDFFEDMVENRGGVTDAKRMKELLIALQSDDVRNVLICCEYRDFPDAGPDAKHEYLAEAMGQAIAKGISFAMFQPFGEVIPLPTDKKPDRPAVNAAVYMTQIQIKCVDAFKLFRQEALAAMQDPEVLSSKPDTIKVLEKDGERIVEKDKLVEHVRVEKGRLSDDHILVSSRLQLYNRPNLDDDCLGYYLGSGFQSRMFYIRYTTVEDKKNHAHILQWVSTPRKDLLVYRRKTGMPPDALKDSFYPIPHFFDSPVGRIPSKIDDADHDGPGVRKYLKQMPGGEGLPAVAGSRSLWVSYD